MAKVILVPLFETVNPLSNEKRYDRAYAVSLPLRPAARYPLTMQTAGEFIRQERERLGVTVKDLAGQMGRGSMWLSRLERNETRMSLDVFVELCRRLCVKPPPHLQPALHAEGGDDSVIMVPDEPEPPPEPNRPRRAYTPDLIVKDADGNAILVAEFKLHGAVSPAEAEAQARRYTEALARGEDVRPLWTTNFDKLQALTLELSGQPYAAVPVYDVRAAAGHGAVNQEATPRAYNFFRQEFVRQVAADPAQLVVIRVDGDSMEPTLHDGDSVLTDRSVRKIGRDGIYVIRPAYDDELLVKRCQRDLRSGAINVLSDNTAYQAQLGLTDADLDVVGRVVWLGRRV